MVEVHILPVLPIEQVEAGHELFEPVGYLIVTEVEGAQARQQTSEAVSESSEERVEAAERKETQAESIESHSARVECEEEGEDTQTEGHLNESDDEEGEVTQDSDSKSMQEWKEDGESEELADSDHLAEPDSKQSTLESYQEVLEENISPDAEELDEDEEVDERVVSNDEGLTGMLDSPYPTVYVDETGFFAETEEQRWKRKLIELYNELPEEMKQLYRELVKTMLESEEGLEKLLDTFPELREYEDFEEEHVDALKYVKFRQKIRELKLLGTQEETTVKELALELDIDQETVKKWLNDDYDSFPKIIQQVWNQEIERRWGNVLRAIANRNVPYDMSEVNEILKRFPELKRKRRFGWYYDEVKAWTEVMAAKRQGKIATLIIQGKERFKVDEVKELARRFNLTMDKIVRWLRDENRPRLVDVLTEKNEFMKEHIQKVVAAQEDKKRKKHIQECNAKHAFRRTDFVAKEEAATTQGDISHTRSESPVVRAYDIESRERKQAGLGRLRDSYEHSDRRQLVGREGTATEACDGERRQEVEQSLVSEQRQKKQELEHHQRKRGEPREVRARTPCVRGQRIESLTELKNIIRRAFPGIQDRDDYNSLMKDAANHLELLQVIGDMRSVKQRNLIQIATRLNIKKHAAVNWTLKGHVPRLYTVLEKAVSKSEAMDMITNFKKQLYGIESWGDVKKQLDKMYPNNEYEQSDAFEMQKRRAIEFFMFLEELKRGGTVKGIASRAGINPARAKSFGFMRGKLPYLVRNAIQSLESQRKPPTLMYGISIAIPRVRGVKIESVHQLKEILEHKFPNFSERSDLPLLLDAVEVHIELIREYGNGEYLSPETVHGLQEQTGFSRDTIRRWLFEGKKPKIYSILDRALTIEEANEKLDEIHSKLRGVTSMKELDRRFWSSYLRERILDLPSYEKARNLSRQFFSFLKALPGGGSSSDIARKAGLRKKAVRSWFGPGALPSLVLMASCIPAEPPEQGRVWLPFKVTAGGLGKPEQFIQVPFEITSPQDLLDVLKQIPSLSTPEMDEYEKQFGAMSNHFAFMYILGVIVSDGWFSSPGVHTSACVKLKASKTYQWSKDFGRGFIYTLGKVGISSMRDKDGVTRLKNGNTVEFRSWRSIQTPFLIWMKESLLGLKSSTPKSQIPIQADWILRMPHDWRVAFLQGVSDGDGWANITASNAGITSMVNKDFLIRLLTSLGVASSRSTTNVLIIKKDAIRRVARLPMFRYAAGRQERLIQITVMLDSVKRSRISEEELKTIMALHKQHFSSGQITKELLSKFGIFRRSSTIRNVIKRNCKKTLENLD